MNDVDHHLLHIFLGFRKPTFRCEWDVYHLPELAVTPRNWRNIVAQHISYVSIGLVVIQSFFPPVRTES